MASIYEQSPHLIKQPWLQAADQLLEHCQKIPILTINSSLYHLETLIAPPGKSFASQLEQMPQTKPSTVAKKCTMSGIVSEIDSLVPSPHH